jgi:hypothetical protein
MMGRAWRGSLVLTAALLAAAAGASVAAAGPRTIGSSGTAQFRSLPFGPDTLGGPEIRHRVGASGAAPSPGGGGFPFPNSPLPTPRVKSSRVAGANPELRTSFNGLTSRDQRLANGGNQFSVEPPDQALCAANERVLESVNTVIRVRDRQGGNVTGVVDLNTFYGYPAQINRATGIFGPFITDPVCLYVPAVGRWVHVVLTIDQDPVTGNFLGSNHLDVAISNSSNPAGTWTVYRIPAQNDGTQGTPNHQCPVPPPADVPPGATNPRAELGDYPHLGMDENGFYITTNGYCFFSDQFNGAQLYAIGFDQLRGATLPAAIRLMHVENTRIAGTPGFTVWPATSFPGEGENAAGGTEYFLSTLAGDGTETGNPTGTANRLGVWALTNTRSLNTSPFAPNVRLQSDVPRSQTYVFPPLSDQKRGPTPLRKCINDTQLPTPFGTGCWNILFTEEPEHDEVISHPDSLDGRMQQTWFVNGTLWGAAGTGVKVDREEKAGIAWFALRPELDRGRLDVRKIDRQGYLALEDNNLTMPSLAIRPDDRGVMAFTVMGEDYHPSAGYTVIDGRQKHEKDVMGAVHVAAEGIGPDDGFSSYKAFVGDPPRTRWGDYGAAWLDGGSLWIASEWIGQRCRLTGPGQYYPTPSTDPAIALAGFGSCNGTRVTLTNWYTRISRVTP